jgi:hypothetical protein
MVTIAISDQRIHEQVANKAVGCTQRRWSVGGRIHIGELFEHGLDGVLRDPTQLRHWIGLIDLL